VTDFYKRLRNTRKANSLTQEELAEKADISRVMISRYESGSVMPTVDVLVSLADALNVSTDYLLGRQNDASINASHPAAPGKNDLPQTKEELRRFILEVLRDCIHLHP